MSKQHPTPADVVRAYARAKSRADVREALRYCSPDTVFETIAFQAVATGIDEVARQTAAFLRTFPDYGVELEYLVATGDLVVGAGTIRATMVESLVGIEPTGRAFALPFACHWRVRDGLVAHERFFFDFHQMCEQLGLSTAEAAARFAAWRERAAAVAR
ncbi:ester cyclase [Nonomuraea wenchangensis]|uniref:Ketosteroid isomerase-related protein n=1 Tax=Nonomuraea wenchangensis TaxID=568860 RepID=A0A1I0LBT8_9ACTN|nr:ester cyclase [Nonomuraea wenchangensis]SEU37029.1 Ketosteroid isomerase-related protein [Nonomuraea wenchangensis]